MQTVRKCVYNIHMSNGEYTLPRGYLSFSQITQWLRSREGYRKHYYFGEGGFSTKETVFGKNIASDLEKDCSDDPYLSKVPRFSHPEYKMELEIDGVPFLGFIDSFDLERKRFREYKTGHRNKKGKSPWDIHKVYNHLQLPLYSLAIEREFGEVEDICYLDWIETDWREKTIEFEGHTLSCGEKELHLTGYVESFERIITQKERDDTAKLLVTVAQEIHDDYQLYS